MLDRLETKGSFTVGDAGEITGTAWPYGTIDRVGDFIEKGAFSSPANLPILFAHDQSQPIGVWDSITETNAGLQVKGRLLINQVARAKEVHALIKEGALTGLSIGFVSKKAASRKGGGRTISKLDLMEVSVVSIPANPGSRITSIKSQENIMDLENEQNEQPDFAALETKFTALETEVKSFNVITSRLDKMEARLNRPGTFQTEQKSNDGEVEKKAFVNFARFGIERMDPIEVKALTVDAGTGGALFPPQYLLEIDKLLVQWSPIRSIARVQSASVGEVILPKRTGVPSVSWTAESVPASSTQSAYGQQAFTIFEQSAYVDVSNRLLEDSMFNLEAEISSDLGQQLAVSESAAFLNGNGIGQPLGMLVDPASAPFSQHLPAGNITQSALIELFHSLPSPYAINGVWIMNRHTIGAIRALSSTIGTTLWFTSGLAAGNPDMLFGRPIVECVDMPNAIDPTLGTANVGAIPIAFGDFKSGYRIFDRVGLSLLRDPYSIQVNSQVRFHARRRVGGAVSKAEAIRFLQVTA